MMETCKDCAHYEACSFNEKLWMNDSFTHLTPCDSCPAFKDRSRFVELPCKVGTHLFRVTKPYRGEPKVTEFVVRNFRTFGKRHQMQLEVQAVNVPGTNWMLYRDFYLTREEAEAELARRTANG